MAWARDSVERHAGGRYGRRRRVRRQRPRRSAAVQPRRAVRAGIAARCRRDRRRGRRAPGSSDLPGRHAAADRAAVGRQRHLRRGDRCDLGRVGARAFAWTSSPQRTSRRQRCWSTPSTRRRAPGSARRSTSTVRLRSTITTTATLRLLADGATVATREIELEPGVTTLPFAVTADEPGFHVFRAVIEPDEDRFTENNAADAYVLVTGEPQVLVATDDAARAADLVESLGDGSLEVTVVPASGVPASLATLAGYDTIVLDNVEADQLGAGTMASLQVYVRDLGKGPRHARRPRQLRGGRLPRHPDRGDAAGVHDRARPRALARRRHGRRRRQVGQHGRLPLHRRQPRRRQPVRHARVREGRHRQGGDPARRRGPGPDRPARRGRLRPERALGRPDRADRLRRSRQRARLRGRWEHEHLRRACRRPTRTSSTTLPRCATSSSSPTAGRPMAPTTTCWRTCRPPASPCPPSAPAADRRGCCVRLAEESGGRYYDAADATTIPDIFLRETIRTAGEQVVEETFQPIPSARPRSSTGSTPAACPSCSATTPRRPRAVATVSLLTGREDPLPGPMAVRPRTGRGLDVRRAPAMGDAMDRNARVRHAHRAAGGLDPAAAGLGGHRRSLQRPASRAS